VFGVVPTVALVNEVFPVLYLDLEALKLGEGG